MKKKMALKACTGETWTVKEYYDDCVKTAKSFVHLGVERNDSVCILGFNSPEWLMSNMGAIMAGGFAAGIYTTNDPAEVLQVEPYHTCIDNFNAEARDENVQDVEKLFKWTSE